MRELAEEEGFRRVGFDRGDGWRRLGLGTEVHSRVLALRLETHAAYRCEGAPPGARAGRGLDRGADRPSRRLRGTRERLVADRGVQVRLSLVRRLSLFGIRGRARSTAASRLLLSLAPTRTPARHRGARLRRHRDRRRALARGPLRRRTVRSGRRGAPTRLSPRLEGPRQSAGAESRCGGSAPLSTRRRPTDPGEADGGGRTARSRREKSCSQRLRPAPERRPPPSTRPWRPGSARGGRWSSSRPRRCSRRWRSPL